MKHARREVPERNEVLVLIVFRTFAARDREKLE